MQNTISEIIFELKQHKIYVSHTTLLCLNKPLFIELLCEKDKHLLLIGGGNTKTSFSISIQEQVYSDASHDCVIVSMGLTGMFCSQLNWDKNERYKVSGEYSPNLGMVVFDLKKAVKIIEEQ